MRPLLVLLQGMAQTHKWSWGHPEPGCQSLNINCIRWKSQTQTNQKKSVKQSGLCSGWLWWTCWKQFQEVLWFNPRQQSRPTQQLTHPPPEELRKIIKRLKAGKHRLRYKQFNRESKTHASKQAPGINSLLSGQAGAQPPPGEQGPIMGNSDLGRQITLNTAPPPSSLLFYMLSLTLCVGDIYWVSWGHCVSSQFHLHSSQPLHWWNGVTSRKALPLGKHCSARTKTSPYYQYYIQHKSKT